MSEGTIFILLALGGAVLGAILSYAQAKKELPWWPALVGALIGAAFPLAIQVSYILKRAVDVQESSIAKERQNNLLARVKDLLLSSSDAAPMIALRRAAAEKMEGQLGELERGILHVGNEADVVAAYMDMVRGARNEILVIAESGGLWPHNREMAGPGRKLEDSRVSEQMIRFRRIWLVPPSASSVLLSKLSRFPGESRFIQSNELDPSLAQVMRVDLLNSSAVVIIDHALVMLIHVEPESRLTRAVLSVDGKQVGAASDLGQRLWAIGRESSSAASR